jgi:hypothetical protein
MNGTVNIGMPSMQLPNGEVNQPEINTMAKLIEQMKQEKAPAADIEQKKASNGLASAGIQAGGQLLGDLFAQAAAQQRAKAQAQLEAAQAGAETQVKGLQSASQAQQDAFTRLMGSMRSALVGG